MFKLRLLLMCCLLAFIISCSSQSSKNVNPSEVMPEMSIPKFEEVKKSYLGKVILVNFFASWCPPCKAEIPDFIKIYEKYKDNFVIIGISIDDDLKKGAEFVINQKIPYPVYHAERALEAKMNVSSIPVNIFYKTDGTLLNFYVGALNEDFVETIIKNQLK